MKNPIAMPITKAPIAVPIIADLTIKKPFVIYN
jgi:hypothetical protein